MTTSDLRTAQLRAGDLWVDSRDDTVGTIIAVTEDGPFDLLTIVARREVLDVPVPVGTSLWHREDGIVTRLA